ncbi:MAG: hypothetical protein AAGB19_03470 [Cyanobacteria bacterium P01_F01_bin.3]
MPTTRPVVITPLPTAIEDTAIEDTAEKPIAEQLIVQREIQRAETALNAPKRQLKRFVGTILQTSEGPKDLYAYYSTQIERNT